MSTNEIQLYLVYNPNAGSGKPEKSIKKITDILKTRNVAFTVFRAKTPEAAQKISRGLEKSGRKNIIAVGGDGTFSEIINGVENLAAVNLGLIPAGTGNDFARTIGISEKIEEALEHILSAQTRQIDYLQGPNRRAINTVSTGIDIEIIQRYKTYKKRNKFSYYRALLKSVFKHKPHDFTINTDVMEIEQKQYFCVAACNGKYFGGGMKVSPNSELNDGRINMVCIHGMKRRKIFLRLLGFLRGTHINKSYVDEYLCENAVINGSQKMTVNYDGELMHDESFDVKIIKGGLNIFFKSEC